VAEGLGETGFADADGTDDGDVRMGVEEAQRRELIEEGAVEGDFRGAIPGLQSHGGIQTSFLDAERDGEAVAPRDFVAEDLQQEILMRELLLARPREAIGQRIEHARQLQPSPDGFEIGADRIGGGHCESSPSDDVAGRSGSAYWSRDGDSARGGMTRAGGGAGAATTLCSSMRFTRWMSNMSAPRASVQTSVTRAAP